MPDPPAGRRQTPSVVRALPHPTAPTALHRRQHARRFHGSKSELPSAGGTMWSTVFAGLGRAGRCTRRGPGPRAGLEGIGSPS